MNKDDFENLLAKQEHEICEIIRNDNKCSTFFTWDNEIIMYSEKCYIKLNVHTYNPRHRSKFLLIRDKIECLNHVEEIQKNKLSMIKKVKDFILETQKTDYNYCVQWNYKGSVTDKIKTSYFSGSSIVEVVKKLYDKNETENLVVYKIEMIAES